MFDPIQGPPDHYSGPSAGLSTEKGDSWHTAVGKINAGFQKVIAAIEGGVHHLVEAIDTEARARIKELEDTVASLQIKLDGFVTAAPKPPLSEPTPVQPIEAKPASAGPETDTL